MSASALTAPETRPRELWERYHHDAAGSPVEGELVEQYLPLVKTVVGRVAMTLPAHVERGDLYSAGLVGLLHAVRHFDPAHGASFATYARVRIRGAVLDELRRMDWTPRPVRDKARKVQAVLRSLEQAKGALPAEEEVAQALNLSVAEYGKLLDEIRPAAFVSLDAVNPSEDDEGVSNAESITDERQDSPATAAVRSDLVALVTARLQQLPENQRRVLALYYVEGLRLREIAEAFGVTESRICQIHTQAILAIRSYVRQQEAPVDSPRKGPA